jgi:hypothetical protein
MQAENFILHHGGKRKEVKELSKILPNIGISVFPLALIVKSVYLSNLSGLVIAS